MGSLEASSGALALDLQSLLPEQGCTVTDSTPPLLLTGDTDTTPKRGQASAGQSKTPSTGFL